MHKVIIVSADPSLIVWPTRKRKLQDIRNELNTMQNAAFTVESTVDATLTPEVRNGRITHDWMDWLRNQYLGYDFVLFHISQKQHKAWGIQPTLRGAHQRDFDLVAEMYFWADQHTKRMRRNQFIQTALHEIRHALCRGMQIPDDTHEEHEDGQIKGSFAHLDMDDYQPALVNQGEQVRLLDRAVSLLWKLFATEPRLHFAAKSYVGADASPEDAVPDAVGCAESVSMVVREVLPDFPIIWGTWTLWRRLESDLRFERVLTPQPGDIIISPTGTGNGVLQNGHVGIVGTDGRIMSNNSFTGLWEYTHTFAEWEAYYRDRGGFPIYYYRLIK